MLRIYTYVNLDAAGDPTNSGASFDPVIYTLKATMGQNTQVQQVRDGTEMLIDDPQAMHPVRLNLSLLMSDIDLKSNAAYGGHDRYLGPVLYYHKSSAMWVVLFVQSDQETSPKAYLCRLLQVDPVLAGCSTIDTSDMTYAPQIEASGTHMEFMLYVDRDGIFTDFDNAASGVYIDREPAS